MSQQTPETPKNSPDTQPSPKPASTDSIDYHILATSTLTDDRIRVLKSNDLFAVFNRFGDIRPHGLDGVHGLYLGDMRFVSLLKLRLAGQRPLFLSSTVKENNALMTVDLTNPDIDINGVRLPADTLHIVRSKFLLENTCYERIRIHNFSKQTVTLPLSIESAGDFADIFELRGNHRDKQGTYAPCTMTGNSTCYSYTGLDNLHRQTEISFLPVPDKITDHDPIQPTGQLNAKIKGQTAHFTIHLEPGQEMIILVTIHCHVDENPELQTPSPAKNNAPQQNKPEMFTAIPIHKKTPTPHREAFQQLISDAQIARLQASEIISSNDLFNRWIARSEADIYMLMTMTDYGPYPYAGTPWYCTVFGRDGLITAYQCLWNMPNLTRGVLAFLAAHQATEYDDELDAEPGKIIHEMRRSEMAMTREVPFKHYYGSIDATPLFIWLAGEYYKRTNDLAFIQSLWPNIKRAVQWMDDTSEKHPDGYLAYHKRAQVGLLQQGWKDSEDSVFHADGNIADPPIALCEVQAYAYGARRAAAIMAENLDDQDFAEIQRTKARTLQTNFERDFWCEDLGLYALAIDGHGQKSRVRSSNSGHCLLTKIASPERAERVANALMHPDFYSGWGIRTLARGESRYNPLSYHNGSIWPHDNSIIAAGFGQYGLREPVLRLLEDFFLCSRFLDLHRLPELFCGLPRRPGEGPTLYPVACSPQAWAAGTVFLLLQSAIGMNINAQTNTISFLNPRLPGSIRELNLHNITLGNATTDIRITHHTHDSAGIQVLSRSPDIQIIVVK